MDFEMLHDDIAAKQADESERARAEGVALAEITRSLQSSLGQLEDEHGPKASREVMRILKQFIDCHF